MKIALAQINIIFEDKHSNYVTVEEFVNQAKDNHADLIIFPEMTCTGFTMNCHEFAEKDNETLYFMKEISKKYQIKICFGQAVYRNNHYYNNLMIIDGDEELLSYDKIHPFQNEAKYYEKGKSINRCFVKQIPISAFICYDLRFPEIFQYASGMSDIIIVIASWPSTRDEHWLSLLKARAIENQCYIIGVNRVGDDPNNSYLGHSVVYNSYGDMITSLSSEEENIYIEIKREDRKKAIKDFDTRQDRRNSLYLDLYNKM